MFIYILFETEIETLCGLAKEYCVYKAVVQFFSSLIIHRKSSELASS